MMMLLAGATSIGTYVCQDASAAFIHTVLAKRCCSLLLLLLLLVSVQRAFALWHISVCQLVCIALMLMQCCPLSTCMDWMHAFLASSYQSKKISISKYSSSSVCNFYCTRTGACQQNGIEGGSLETWLGHASLSNR